jgi:hypothetical protein
MVVVLGMAAARPAAAAPAPFLAPAPLPLERSLTRPTWIEMVGATSTQALLELRSSAPVASYEAVLDLSTGCFTESIAPTPRVHALEVAHVARRFDRSATATKEQAWIGSELADPVVQDQLRSYLAVAERFGRHSLQDWAWSDDGSKILAMPGEVAFRSHDGGRTFQRIDAHQARSPFVTRDGRWAMYERCREAGVHHGVCPPTARDIVVFAADGDGPLRRVNIGRSTIVGLDPSGEALVLADDNDRRKLAIMHLDPATATLRPAFDVTTRPRPSGKFFTIDPSREGRFGTFNSVENPTTTVQLIDMTTGKSMRTMRGNESAFGLIELDEEGRMAWWFFRDNHARAATAKGPVRDLGPGMVIGWAPGGRVLTYDVGIKDGRGAPVPPGTIGDQACSVVKVHTVAR